MRRRRRPFSGAGDAPRKGKTTGEHKELTTNPFPRSVRAEDDRRSESTRSKGSSTSNGNQRWRGMIPAVRSRSRGWERWRRCRGRFPHEESRFGGRRREIDGKGRRRRERSLRSALDEVRRRKREMTSGSHIHPNKYLGDAWWTVRRPRADCP